MLFDTSDYKESKLCDIPGVNKQLLGKMKDKNYGKMLAEITVLRSTMYFSKPVFNVKKTSKGVNQCVIRKGGGFILRTQKLFA